MSSLSQKPKVLVVDDEDILRQLIGMTIEFLGMEMLEAESGESALKVIEKHSVAFVITDYNMPGIGGLEFAKRVKTISPKTQVLMVTGSFDENIQIQAKQIGIYKVIHKPYDYAELEQVIRALASQVGK